MDENVRQAVVLIRKARNEGRIGLDVVRVLERAKKSMRIIILALENECFSFKRKNGSIVEVSDGPDGNLINKKFARLEAFETYAAT